MNAGLLGQLFLGRAAGHAQLAHAQGEVPNGSILETQALSLDRRILLVYRI